MHTPSSLLGSALPFGLISIRILYHCSGGVHPIHLVPWLRGFPSISKQSNMFFPYTDPSLDGVSDEQMSNGMIVSILNDVQMSK